MRTRRLPDPAGLVSMLVLAGALVTLGFTTTGGFDESITVSAGNTWAEIVIVVLGAGAVATMLAVSEVGRSWGAAALGLFVLVTALTAASIIWSVQPDASWQAANLTLAYLMAFAAAFAVARVAPERWWVLVGAIGLAAVVLAGWGLLTKVFPGSLAAAETQGRLQAPLGYWNATGALAVLGVAPVLWSYVRPAQRAAVRGLSVPALSILISVAVLSYSRTALVVLIVTVAGWLLVVPGRLRTVAMLAASGAGAAIICGWALGHSGLTSDSATLAARTSQGHTFGLLLILVLLILAVAGAALARVSERVRLSDRQRRRIGAVLLGLLALVPVAAVIALAESSRGLTGEISHAWSSFTSTSGAVSNSASRITQFGSSRPLYWSEGITVGEHALFKGVGALGYATARTRYTTNTHVAGHAHSYVVQTFADLGLLGIAFNLALLGAWLVSALRAVRAGVRWRDLPAAVAGERQGLIALCVVAVSFGLNSALDWTWYFPAVTIPALLAAGWVSGRAPVTAAVRRPDRASILSRPGTLAGVSAVVLVAIVCAWLILQPLRSSEDAAAALTAPSTAAALGDARSAKAADPLALQPRFVLSALYAAIGRADAARRELVAAVNLQPDNHDSWLQLGLYDLHRRALRPALHELEVAAALDPTVAATLQGIAQARAQLAARNP